MVVLFLKAVKAFNLQNVQSLPIFRTLVICLAAALKSCPQKCLLQFSELFVSIWPENLHFRTAFSWTEQQSIKCEVLRRTKLGLSNDVMEVNGLGLTNRGRGQIFLYPGA